MQAAAQQQLKPVNADFLNFIARNCAFCSEQNEEFQQSNKQNKHLNKMNQQNSTANIADKQEMQDEEALINWLMFETTNDLIDACKYNKQITADTTITEISTNSNSDNSKAITNSSGDNSKAITFTQVVNISNNSEIHAYNCQVALFNLYRKYKRIVNELKQETLVSSKSCLQETTDASIYANSTATNDASIYTNSTATNDATNDATTIQLARNVSFRQIMFASNMRDMFKRLYNFTRSDMFNSLQSSQQCFVIDSMMINEDLQEIPIATTTFMQNAANDATIETNADLLELIKQCKQDFYEELDLINEPHHYHAVSDDGSVIEGNENAFKDYLIAYNLTSPFA